MAKTDISFSVARSPDGTVQITFTIPYELVEKAQEETLKEYAQTTEVPGFRKGKAPLKEVEKRISRSSLIEHSLGHLLPKALGRAITEHKIKAAIYPKFELVKTEEGSPWEVRGLTCEIPEVNLGDYKKIVSGAKRAKDLWTPEKGSPKEKKEPSQEEKEQELIKVVLENVKVEVPKLLIDEEVNSRLSSLLEKIEKLGLTLESYLSSVGKTPESLRGEYEAQAKNTISLELILTKIASEEKLEVKEEEIDAAIKGASTDAKVTEKLNSPEQRRMIRTVLERRKALDYLTSLL